MKEYELYHASRRKHKYIKKIGKRYFYTQEEIQAYLDGRNPKDGGKIGELKEAVAEATGKRDVYFEAKKVTEDGRTFYDDDNPTLRTGKKDKRGKVDKTDGSVYTKRGTMQYDNDYTRERNAKTRARGRKKLKQFATAPIRSLKKHADKGKKLVDEITNPKSTVTVIDRMDMRTGEHF